MLLCAAFATLTLHRFVGPALGLAVFVPYGRDGAKAYWNRVRLVFGLVWLGIIVATTLSGRSDGVLVRLDVLASQLSP
jgi:hypothetical protein